MCLYVCDPTYIHTYIHTSHCFASLRYSDCQKICTYNWEPVCSKGGVTFLNECYAKCNRVEEFRCENMCQKCEGACSRCVPSPRGLTCCGEGGSWHGKCGDTGDSRYGFTWDEGLEVCGSKTRAPKTSTTKPKTTAPDPTRKPALKPTTPKPTTPKPTPPKPTTLEPTTLKQTTLRRTTLKPTTPIFPFSTKTPGNWSPLLPDCRYLLQQRTHVGDIEKN